jgi:N-acetylglucosaminyldiphosphoundecaprenol N-acetyl-beta-D-mannosaminyltransferase
MWTDSFPSNEIVALNGEFQERQCEDGDSACRIELPPRTNVLGVGISVVSLESATDLVFEAIRSKRKGYVCVTSVHGVIESQDCERFRSILNRSFLTTPDGMPVVWVGKWNGHTDIERVYGPDLMLSVCERGIAEGTTHYFFGGKEGVADLLAERLTERFPGLRVVGVYTPPFRPLSDEERRDLIDEMAELKPDCFWVGLSTPKQERFMHEFIEDLESTLMFGVGAAFDFHAGLVRQAPRWMQRSGLEWMFRLCMEPRRLWKRYLVNNTRFIGRMAARRLSVDRAELETGGNSA